MCVPIGSHRPRFSRPFSKSHWQREQSGPYGSANRLHHRPAEFWSLPLSSQGFPDSSCADDSTNRNIPLCNLLPDWSGRYAGWPALVEAKQGAKGRRKGGSKFDPFRTTGGVRRKPEYADPLIHVRVSGAELPAEAGAAASALAASFDQTGL
jgi:hypothetical protein